MTALQSSSQEKLRNYIERLERIDEERLAAIADAKEVMDQAKSDGFDPKIMRIIVRRRKMTAAIRAQQDALVDTYSSALGMTAEEADSEEETTSSSD